MTGEEGDTLQHPPPAGILARERLHQARKLGKEEVQEWPRSQLGHAPSALRLDLRTELQWPAVEALDVMDPWVTQQRSQEAVDELRVDIADVGVDPADQVAREREEAFPERFTLPLKGAIAGKDLAVLYHGDAGTFRDGGGAVGRSRVDDHDLIDQRDPLHQCGLESANHLADS